MSDNSHIHSSGQPDLGPVARQTAHDSANWLAAALGHLNRLEAGLAGPETATALRGIRVALEACDELQARLLAYAQGAGPPTQPRVWCELAPLVEPVVTAFRSASTPAVAVESHLTPGVVARVEPQSVANATANLVANALAVTSEGSVCIEVDSPAGSGLACIRVRDTGPGMDEATRDRAVEEGFSTRGSTGLGLAEVQRTARVHGARFRIDSAPGAGTTVELAFLSAEAHLDVPGAEVLLVDDDPAVAEMLGVFFEESGIPARHAWTGEEALQSFRTGPVPVVLLDLQLPDRSGLEVANLIRQVDPSVGIVLLTGERFDLTPDVESVDAVLRKPVELTHLQRTLTEARRRHDERQASTPHRDDAQA